MKFDILTLDLHNTIYDEVMEYGLAIDEAIKLLPAPREVLYEQLSIEHAKLGSDWDDDVWQMLPCLKNTPPEIIEKAISARHAKSKELTIAYGGVVETLKTLQAKDVRIYIVTEAAADVGMQAISWLDLGGVVKGVYTYPSRKKPIEIAGTFHKPFPQTTNGHLKKPDPLLLKQVLQDDGCAGEMLFVGDSKFKDGTMAKSAGVKFAWAAYGKKIPAGQEANFERSKEILYAVTGWDKDVLKLTQEASRSKEIDELQPDYILENNFSDILHIFNN